MKSRTDTTHVADAELRAGETTRYRPFAIYATIQTLAVIAFMFVRGDSRTWLDSTLQVAVGWGAAGAVFFAVRYHRPEGSRGWLAYGAAMFLNVCGIAIDQFINGPLVESPTVADLFWVAMYPGLAAGMAIFIRHRSPERDWASIVDTAIITTGFALLAWVFLIKPAASNPALKVTELVAVSAYPLGDLVVLALMIRLVLAGGTPSKSFRILVGAMLTHLLTDFGWAVLHAIQRDPKSTVEHVLETMAMIAFALMGAAAIHPSSTAVARPSQRVRTYLSPVLLAGLTTASLIAPAVLFWQVFHHEVTDGGAIALSASVLFLLVVVRMAQLLRKIEDRTSELGRRNRALRLVLDTVNDGLLRITEDGTLLLERSAIIDRWFRPFERAMPFATYIEPFDAKFAETFRLAHEALRDNLMPPEICLDQLPSRLHAGKRTFDVSYLPVTDGDRPDGHLVVMRDITEQLELAQQDAEQRELLAMFQLFAHNQTGFLTFFEEASSLVDQVAAKTLDFGTQRRALHTLKGNASMARLPIVAALCHKAEDEMDEGNDARSGTLGEIRDRWSTLTDAFGALLGRNGWDMVFVPARELEQLADDVRRGMATPVLLERLASLRDEPAERPLERLAAHARELARRYDKGEVSVSVDGGGVRLEPRHWAPVWSQLVHVIRNAIDHGFETPEEREESGKPASMRLKLAVALQRDELKIEIEDDGRGIDWDALRHAAAKKGMSADTEDALLEVLLDKGVSSREEVTTLSGRGAGLPAVADTVRQLSGRITVTSAKARGTTWRLAFPASEATRRDPREARSGSAAA